MWPAEDPADSGRAEDTAGTGCPEDPAGTERAEDPAGAGCPEDPAGTGQQAEHMEQLENKKKM